MATIKYNEDEQGNKKIIVKTDPETDQQKVSCGCCACEGCGTLNDALGLDSSVTSISYSWSLTGVFFQGGQPSTISNQGTMLLADCGANKFGVVETVTLQIIKSVDDCKLSVSAGNFSPFSPCQRPGSGEIILDPNSPIALPITIPLSGSTPCGTVNGTLTIS